MRCGTASSHGESHKKIGMIDTGLMSYGIVSNIVKHDQGQALDLRGGCRLTHLARPGFANYPHNRKLWAGDN